MHAFLRRMTGDAAAAEDLAQDVFLRVIRGLESYEEKGRDLPWLFRIARHLLIDRSRSARRGLALVEDVDAPAHEASPLLRLELDEALHALGEQDREAFLLREVGGLGYDEIALVVGGT